MELFRRFFALHPDGENGYCWTTLADVKTLSEKLRNRNQDVSTGEIIRYLQNRTLRGAGYRFKGSVRSLKSQMRGLYWRERNKQGSSGTATPIGLQFTSSGQQAYYNRTEDAWILPQQEGYYNITDPAHIHGVKYRERLPEEFQSEREFDEMVPRYSGPSTPAVVEHPGIFGGSHTLSLDLTPQQDAMTSAATDAMPTAEVQSPSALEAVGSTGTGDTPERDEGINEMITIQTVV
ncbi:hypothetical protein L596_017907 [Steinernema carpocapsae]|uniref:Uncharacterized protein n=1 Tax=Steinernema carpocapsae TaxID=34508 RepID=A0A4U5N319_STECR|nr:hypothetical protein L596_017907 [Steinernema carpocapsae]